jgi:hypothetical protein
MLSGIVLRPLRSKGWNRPRRKRQSGLFLAGVPIFDQDEGWDCAIDCGPYMESGYWVMMMVDDQIRLLEEKLGKDPAFAGIEIEICWHDGLYPGSLDYYLKTNRELRSEREYTIKPEQVKSYIALFSDKPEVSWLKAVGEV